MKHIERALKQKIIEDHFKYNIGFKPSFLHSDEIIFHDSPDYKDLKRVLQNNINFETTLAKNLYTETQELSNKIKIPKNAQKVANILKSVKGNSYIVGGFIRDNILGLKSKDVDFVTDVDYDILTVIFRENGFTVDEVGKKYLVLLVTTDHESFEITNFRKDGIYLDGRRPEDVLIGTPEEDAKRRDFTCNALYFDIKTGIIHDFIGTAIEDCKNKLLKFIGNPNDRLKEDYLRGWRFYRFIDKGFTPDKKSLRAVRENFKNVCSVAPERIMNEIERIVLK